MNAMFLFIRGKLQNLKERLRASTPVYLLYEPVFTTLHGTLLERRRLSKGTRLRNTHPFIRCQRFNC